MQEEKARVLPIVLQFLLATCGTPRFCPLPPWNLSITNTFDPVEVVIGWKLSEIPETSSTMYYQVYGIGVWYAFPRYPRARIHCSCWMLDSYSILIGSEKRFRQQWHHPEIKSRGSKNTSTGRVWIIRSGNRDWPAWVRNACTLARPSVEYYL